MNINDLMNASSEFTAYVKACKADMLSALQAQSVEVDSNTLLSAFAGKISQIVGGGGGTVLAVTFLNWDLTVLKTQQVLQGGDVNPPASPTRAGWSFSGWSASATNVQANMTITAQFSYSPNTVVLLDYDLTLLSKLTVATGSDVTANTPTQSQMVFKNWSDSLVNIQGNKAIIARYNPFPSMLYLYLTLTEETGLTLDFNVNPNSSPCQVNFGDGNVGYAVVNYDTVSHTYSAYGNYVASFPAKSTIGYNTGVQNYIKGALLGNQAKAITKVIDGIKGATGSIGHNAMQNAINLTKVHIDDSETSIGLYQFDGCTSIESIVIPAAVTTVSSYAFSNCTALSKLVFLGSTPTFGASLLGGVPSTCEIFVPDTHISAYQNALISYQQVVKGLSELTTKY